MPNQKRSLDLPVFKTVTDLRAELIYLENMNNRTQVRNACQLILLRNYHVEMLRLYDIRGGIRMLILYEIIRIEADICEGLLYAIQTKYLGHKPKSKVSLESLINFAKTIREPRILLSRKTTKGLNEVLKIRNNLHAGKQTELHTELVKNLIRDKILRLHVVGAHHNLIQDIEMYYNIK